MYSFDEVPILDAYADSDDMTQKQQSRMKSVMDDFAVRLSELKHEAYTQILQGGSGIHGAARAVIGGQPLFRAQAHTLLLGSDHKDLERVVRHTSIIEVGDAMDDRTMLQARVSEVCPALHFPAHRAAGVPFDTTHFAGVNYATR